MSEETVEVTEDRAGLVAEEPDQGEVSGDEEAEDDEESGDGSEGSGE